MRTFLIEFIAFSVQKLELYYLTKSPQELPRHSMALYFCVGDTVIELLICLILMRIFQNSPNKLHTNSSSEKIASPRFHAVSVVSK